MKEVKKDFPDIPVVSLNDYEKSWNKRIRDEWERNYHWGNLKRFFNIEEDSLNSVNYAYYDHKDANKLIPHIGKFTKDATYPVGRYRVMLMGTSMNENLLQFLPYSGAKTRYIRFNRGQVKKPDEFNVMKLYRKDILSFKPDILVLCITSMDLLSMQNLSQN